MTDAFTLFTIYRNMPEHPGKHVVVRFFVRAAALIPDKTAWAVCDDLKDARLSLPRGLACLQRAEDDAECVVETWI